MAFASFLSKVSHFKKQSVGEENAAYCFQIFFYVSEIIKTWSELSKISQSTRTRYGCKHLRHTRELIELEMANVKQNM